MSLRPRYSLLTLLILTALVAGGVKLWYGPHHVVHGFGTADEDEYTYTFDLQGNQVIQGPRIIRSRIDRGGFLVEVKYFRNGEELPWTYTICSVPLRKPILLIPDWGRAQSNPLTAEEQLECERFIQQEKSKVVQPGMELSEYDGVPLIKVY